MLERLLAYVLVIGVLIWGVSELGRSHDVGHATPAKMPPPHAPSPTTREPALPSSAPQHDDPVQAEPPPDPPAQEPPPVYTEPIAPPAEPPPQGPFVADPQPVEPSPEPAPAEPENGGGLLGILG